MHKSYQLPCLMFLFLTGLLLNHHRQSTEPARLFSQTDRIEVVESELRFQGIVVDRQRLVAGFFSRSVAHQIPRRLLQPGAPASQTLWVCLPLSDFGSNASQFTQAYVFHTKPITAQPQ